MRTQAEIETLEAKLDFGALNQALLERLKRGEFGQRKTVNTLLERIGDTLAELRRRRVPLREIVRELKAHGLAVSESRVRAYLRSRGMVEPKAQGRRRKPQPASERALKTPPAPEGHVAVGSAPLSLPLG